MPRPFLDFEMEGRSVRLRNLDKEFFPKSGFTKGDVIQYYAKAAPVLLPHLRDRPLTLKRYPDGVEGGYFYQKEAPSPLPDWVQTATVRHGRKAVRYVLCNDLSTLMWLCNLANLEFHPLLADAAHPNRPKVVAFDLDPGAPASIQSCAQVALALKDALKEDRLAAFPKTSGGKGIQVYVPLNTRGRFDATRSFARSLARRMHREHPRLVTSNMRREVRRGKVLIDWSQNHPSKTTVSVYSLRAAPRPNGSTPVAWREVEESAAHDKPTLTFQASQILARVQKRGDLFRPVLEKRQHLPEGRFPSPTRKRQPPSGSGPSSDL